MITIFAQAEVLDGKRVDGLKYCFSVGMMVVGDSINNYWWYCVQFVYGVYVENKIVITSTSGAPLQSCNRVVRNMSIVLVLFNSTEALADVIVASVLNYILKGIL